MESQKSFSFLFFSSKFLCLKHLVFDSNFCISLFLCFSFQALIKIAFVTSEKKKEEVCLFFSNLTRYINMTAPSTNPQRLHTASYELNLCLPVSWLNTSMHLITAASFSSSVLSKRERLFKPSSFPTCLAPNHLGPLEDCLSIYSCCLLIFFVFWWGVLFALSAGTEMYLDFFLIPLGI